jgi:hypothetical protein
MFIGLDRDDSNVCSKKSLSWDVSLSDAIYFRLYDQKLIESWSEKNHANTILKYYDWIMEDFSAIHNSNSTRDDVFKSTQLVGGLTIFLGNRIEFSPIAFNAYQQHHNKYNNKNDPARRNITQAWLNRFNSTIGS